MRPKISPVFLLVFPLLLSYYCSTKGGVKPGTVPPEQSAVSKGEDRIKEIEKKEDIFQAGVASWYGEKFQGRKTANGEIYDMHKLTAAHKTLAFNTLVEVTNLENHRKVMVRINDRGPFVKDRVIDLSLEAAERLGMAEPGTAPVSLKIVKSTGIGNLEEKVSPQHSYFLQVGAFKDRANAHKILRKVESILPGISFKIYFKDGYYKVISDKIAGRSKSRELKQVLEDNHIDAYIKEYM